MKVTLNKLKLEDNTTYQEEPFMNTKVNDILKLVFNKISGPQRAILY